MTLNCPLNELGQPLSLFNETFILFRQHIEFDISIEGVGKRKAKGTAYLTSLRIIFVPSKPDPQFFSFDIPIYNLFKENVEMPIFGSTYLEGSVTPYLNLLPGLSHFKLYFKEGGCDTFIKILSRLIKQVRAAQKNNINMNNLNNQPFFSDVRSGNFNFNAYVNPNDPSKLYTKQA